MYTVELEPASFRLKFRRRRLFQYNYDLIVDGYWRSANTFVTEAFHLLQPSLRIRAHRHSPLHVINAILARKAVCLLIRKPIDAIASVVVFSGVNLSLAIEDYIEYYYPLLSYRNRCVVVDFDVATKDIASVVDRVGFVYSLRLNTPHVDATFLAKVFDGVKSYPWSGDLRTTSVPMEKRNSLLEDVKKLAAQDVYVERMSFAYKIYSAFINKNK